MSLIVRGSPGIWSLLADHPGSMHLLLGTDGRLLVRVTSFESMNAVEYAWRGDFTSSQANQLHADAFNHRVYEESEWDWVRLCHEHSLGWVTALIDGRLVGFVNVLWDGLVHAWIQDEMVSLDTRNQGIGLRLIDVAREAAKQAGCEWLHVDFDDDLRPFYIDAAGFTPTNGGLINLTDPD